MKSFKLKLAYLRVGEQTPKGLFFFTGAGVVNLFKLQLACF